MSRVKINRSLPPLNEILESFTHHVEGKSHQQAIHDILYDIAKKLRSSHSKPFYSMRELAKFFGVPLMTIARVYRTLEREQIISRIRSSHTVLVGTDFLPQEGVRGVIGLCIWVQSMVQLNYTQTFVMEFEEKLRHAGYVADIIFHRQKEEELQPELTARLLRHRLDAIVIHSPLQGAIQNILSLRERGVRVLLVQRKDTQFPMPAVIYLQDYHPAYQKMAALWYELGIRKVLLCTPPKDPLYSVETNIFKSILHHQGIESELSQGEPLQLLQRIRQRDTKEIKAVAFLDSAHSEEFCNRDPQIIEQIAQSIRLAFCVGPIRAAYLRSRQIRADVVDFSPSEVASRLIDDICRLSILPDGVYHTFTANFHDQMII